MTQQLEVVARAEALARAEKSRASHLMQALVEAAHSPTSSCVLQYADAALVGVAQVDHLAFDSEIFGGKIGRLSAAKALAPELYAPLLARAVGAAHEAGLQHLTRRINARDIAEARALETVGFRLVDTGVLFSRPVTAGGPPQGVRPIAGDEVETLIGHCAGIFGNSRFSNDPFFDSAAAIELHRRWIRNCCTGRADVVLVPEAEGPVGFVTCTVPKGTQYGNIELLGVSERFRGHQIGRRLIEGALAWFAQRVPRVEVRTQLINRAATTLYEGAGFKIIEGELTFSYTRPA
jgi:ribosomal protein S18 acetylase RimI-like enzyme